jgi:hypothetical protein
MLAPDGDTVTVFHDAATKRLDIQISTHVALDSKLGNVLTVGSAILPITFGLLGLSETDVPLSAAVFLVLAGVAYAVLLALSWLTVARTSGMATGAPISVIREHVARKQYSGEELRLWTAEEYESSIARNEQILLWHST